jgi:hypothetical protein
MLLDAGVSRYLFLLLPKSDEEYLHRKARANHGMGEQVSACIRKSGGRGAYEQSCALSRNELMSSDYITSSGQDF